MAKYSDTTHKVTLFGDMFGGTEIWTTGFFLGSPSGWGLGVIPTQAEADAIQTAFGTFWGTTGVGINQNYRYLGAKVSQINTDGTSDPANTKYSYRATPLAGPGTVVVMPPQVSLAITLQTTKSRGRGSKGRMYIPGISYNPDATGHIPSTNQTAINSALKTFLDAVQGSTDVPGQVVVMSAEVAGVPFKAAEMNYVQSVKTGNVYDTQRRRRNALVESYVSATLA
jgi:hypothetical protein